MNRLTVTAALLLFGAAWHAAHAAAPGGVAAGRALFDADCVMCHHADGSGGVHFGHGVVSADLRAPGLEQTYRGDDALIVRAIRHGLDQNGRPLHAPMPHWAGTLSVAQADDVVAYLHTLKHTSKPTP